MTEFEEIISRMARNDESLIDINLSIEEITDNQAKTLAEALKENSTVRRINIQHNKISDEGIVEIINALKKNKAIEDINFKFPKTQNGIKYLMDAIQNNEIKVKNIGLYKGVDVKTKWQEFANALEKNHTLSGISFRFVGMKGDALAEVSNVVEKTQTLKSLDINGSFPTAIGLKKFLTALESNASLNKLSTGFTTDLETKNLIAVIMQRNKNLPEIITDKIISGLGNLEDVEASLSVAERKFIYSDLSPNNCKEILTHLMSKKPVEEIEELLQNLNKVNFGKRILVSSAQVIEGFADSVPREKALIVEKKLSQIGVEDLLQTKGVKKDFSQVVFPAKTLPKDSLRKIFEYVTLGDIKREKPENIENIPQPPSSTVETSGQKEGVTPILPPTDNSRKR